MQQLRTTVYGEASGTTMASSAALNETLNSNTGSSKIALTKSTLFDQISFPVKENVFQESKESSGTNELCHSQAGWSKEPEVMSVD